MSDEKCKCSLRESMLGDGCKVCQPRTYIAKIEDALQSAESEIEQLEQELAEAKAALAAQAQQEETKQVSCPENLSRISPVVALATPAPEGGE